MATGETQFLPPSSDHTPSPMVTDTAVDYSSLSRVTVQEELERKLKCRAERDHLVQKNILPAVSTAPVILAQTHKLQRQKTADTLQQKLRDRASRNELYQRNILPDSKMSVDPSLSATQMRLQKRRIADDLNTRISNRPGILELVEGHILEPNLGKALESYLQDAESVSPDLLDRLNSQTMPSPTSSLGLSLHSNDGSILYEHKLSDSTSPVLSPGDANRDDHSPQKSPAGLLSPLGEVPAPPPPPPILRGKQIKILNNQHHPCKAPSPSQTRKRQHKPKYRKLRYHEYIPPSKSGAKGGKTNSISKPSPAETPYTLLLQQQQLFLQLQVLQQQYPNGVLVQKLPELLKNLPASLTEKAQALLKPKTAGMETNRPLTKTHEIPDDIKVRTMTGNGTMTVRLDELKVNALKSACKEQNLIVSGKKVDLIERLLEHNNGILPAIVLVDNSKERRQSFMSHSVSLDSSHKSTSNSPQSPDQDMMFQFPGKTAFSSSNGGVQSMECSVGSPMMNGAVPLQASDLQQRVEKMVEKKKIDFFSANGPKKVAPKPDLSKMVSINQPAGGEDKSSSNAFKHSKSLPTTPQQLSPAGSSDNLLYELMEQSPKPPLPHLNVSPDSRMFFSSNMSSSGQYVNPQRRSGRASLPNPPPYPGGGFHNPNFQQNDLTGSGHFGFQQVHQQPHLIAHRSLSLSGPASNNHHQMGSTLLPENPPGLPGNPNSSDPLAAFSTDDTIGLNEIIEMETDFGDLFKILEKEEHGTSALAQTHSSSSFDHVPRMPLPHQDSTQSDSVMFGVPMNHNIKSNSMELLSSLGGGANPHENKPPISSNGTHNYNEFGGMLNLDSSLLGSSPNMQGYFPDAQSTMHQGAYDYFQNGLADDVGFKPSSGVADFTSSLESHPLMENNGLGSHISGGNVGGLFGMDGSTFLDMNLTS